MSSSSVRRNGSQASCEPCRLGKTRCDHQKPVCGACQRRVRQKRCWYHPAPLTKPRASRSASRREAALTSTITSVTPPATVSSASIASPGSPNNTRHGGFESFAAATESRLSQTASSSLEIPHDAFRTSDNPATFAEHIESAREILATLELFDEIDNFVTQYYSFSQVPVVPERIIQGLIQGIRGSAVLANHTTDTAQCLALLKCSSEDVELSPNITVDEFCELFSGDNLRLETIGLLCSLAARATFYTSIRSNHFLPEHILQRLVRCSVLTVRLARDLATHSNDVIIWLAYDNLQLMTLVKGDSSLDVWRRLSELVTDVLSLNLHKESTYNIEKLPFFLIECRRQTFAIAYHIDKIISNVFDRPPRCSSRHCDCEPPLDISDAAMFSMTLLAQEQQSMTPGGWNTGGYRRTTWARIRFLLSKFREEVAEYQSRQALVSELDLRALAERCRSTWDTLPEHLRHDQDSVLPGSPLGVHIFVAKIYVHYLHINFQICGLLDAKAGYQSDATREVSWTLMQTLLHMASMRDKGSFIPRDLPSNFLSYGCPCALVLIELLDKIARGGTQSLPLGISKPFMIRRLAVFISQLETICGPTDINYKVCTQAASALSRKLDKILEEPAHADGPSPSMQIPLGSSMNSAGLLDFNSPFVDDFGTFNFELSSWAMDGDFAHGGWKMTSDGNPL